LPIAKSANYRNYVYIIDIVYLILIARLAQTKGRVENPDSMCVVIINGPHRLCFSHNLSRRVGMRLGGLRLAGLAKR